MPQQQQPGSSLALPDDLRADLLRAQTENLSIVSLPSVKIMGQGAGLFEFKDTGDTVREFTGVILNSHNRNVLWTKEYGTPAVRDEDKLPDCASPDGRYGIPKPGFAHAALNGDEARGNERISCATCPYNQWDSAKLINKRGKGKANTNQKAVYVLLENRELPVRLTLPPTSLKALDQYMLTLANQGVPVQTVATKFAQDRVTKGGFQVGVLTLTNVGTLDPQTFADVLARRAKYMHLITPIDPTREDVDFQRAAEGEDDDDVPF